MIKNNDIEIIDITDSKIFKKEFDILKYKLDHIQKLENTRMYINASFLKEIIRRFENYTAVHEVDQTTINVYKRENKILSDQLRNFEIDKEKEGG